MRIAFLSVFYPYRGGIAQFNERLVEELQKNHEVKCYNYSLQYPGLFFPGKSQYVNEGEPPWEVETIRTLNSINPLTWSKTARTIERFDPETLVVRLWIPFLAPSSSKVIKILKKKNPQLEVVAVLDNVIPHEKRRMDKSWVRTFLNCCDRFVLMSNSVAEELKSFIPSADYQLSDHPINDRFPNNISREEARKSLNLMENERVVLFFGFIRDYKGLDILIDSKTKSKIKWKLIIVGECYGSIEIYEKQIKKLGLNDEVLLLNQYVSDEEIQRYFKSADLCALPYKSATQSGIIPVALHFNLPVITTDVGGLAEYVEDGVNGIILNNNNSKELSEEIDSFFTENKAEKLKEGIEINKNKYSWDRFSRAIINAENS